jgi:hypothetical protein
MPCISAQNLRPFVDVNAPKNDIPRLSLPTAVYYLGPGKGGLPSYGLIRYVICLGIEVARIDRATSQNIFGKGESRPLY